MPSELDQLVSKVLPSIEETVTAALGPWTDREVSKLVAVKNVGELDRLVVQSIRETSTTVPVAPPAEGEELELIAFTAETVTLLEMSWTKQLSGADLNNLNAATTAEAVKEQIRTWATRARTRQLTMAVEAVRRSAATVRRDVSLESIQAAIGCADGTAWRLVLPAGTVLKTDDLTAWLGSDGYVVLPGTVPLPRGWWAIAYARDPSTLTRLQAFDLRLTWERGDQADSVELRLKERYRLVPQVGVGAIALTTP